MKIILLCNMEQKEELMSQMQNVSAELIYSNDPAEALTSKADACIDLLFDDTTGRVNKLLQLKTKTTIINSVLTTLDELPANFIRINGWNTFLKRPIIEAAAPEKVKKEAEQVFSLFNKKIEWVTDITGFISVRVVAAIINEAYFALEEEVSTKEEIDTAMKLGTNYPYGPFEWSQKIGLKRIFNLLDRLSGEQPRYKPAALLVKEANS